ESVAQSDAHGDRAHHVGGGRADRPIFEESRPTPMTIGAAWGRSTLRVRLSPCFVIRCGDACLLPPNPRMQQTGRSGREVSVRPQRTVNALWSVGFCAR